MVSIELHVDEHLLHEAQRLAKARGSTVEAVLTEILERSLSADAADPWLGMFADEPDLLDEVVGLAMLARERDALRANNE